jgi:ubiquinone/menaquinone biosynthesis C-methylase UbiE
MAFDKQYFDDIWGNVHRHDYCETLATELIAKYNPKSFLDIGTGCGELVRVLREKGVEAYGLEISEYAVANSHGNVVLGSVTGIPFKDKSFDVVYSQGLWEYVTEQDIDRAYKECLRVGKRQEHNIDTLTDTADWSADFATHKSAEWWDEKLKQPKILVACPTHEVKDYAMQRWIDNIKSFTLPQLRSFSGR